MKKIFLFISISWIGLALAGCQNQEVNHYYMVLTSESDHWKLSGYEVAFSSEELKLGNGLLSMKHAEKYITDSYHFNTYIVTNGEESRVHAGGASGSGIDIAEEKTGTIEGGAEFDLHHLTPKDIDQIFMEVEWWDSDKEDNIKERIELYSGADEDESILD